MIDIKYDKCATCSWWNDNLDYYPEVCFVCMNADNYRKNDTADELFSKYGKRVKIIEKRDGLFAGKPIYRIEIYYSYGDLFFNGWVDNDLMPILFGQARENKLIPDDIAIPMNNFPSIENGENVIFRKAEISDKNEIIDLRFQSFFEGGANCISAIQSLNQIFDNDHYTIVVEFSGQIVGLIYGYTRNRIEFYIEYIYVHQNFRNGSIGSKLLFEIEKVARNLSCCKVTTLIQGKQEHANIVFNFNLKNGFVYNENDVINLGNDFLAVTMEKNIEKISG